MSIPHFTPAPPCAKALSCRPAPAALLAIILLAAPVCFADPALTLPEAQRLALQRSRQLAVHDHTADAARQMAVAAAQLPDPVLKAGIDNLPLSGADRFNLGSDFMTMRRIGISQELTSTDKRRRRAELFAQEQGKALAEKNAATARIERETALAWLESYFTRQIARLIAEQAVQAANDIEAAASTYRGGRGSLADIAAARGALALVQDRVAEALRHSRNAALMLARWSGQDTAVPLAGLPAMDVVSVDLAALKQGLDTVLAHHPAITVLTRQERLAQAEANLAAAATKADWSLEVALQQRGASYSNMVSVGISVPLQWDRPNRQHREVAMKLALAEAAKAEREEAEREHLAQIRAMADEWDTNRARLVRLDKDLLPQARQRTEATLAAYRGGKATLMELLTARRGETDAALRVLQLQAETARLWAQLNYLIPSVQSAEVAK